MKRVFVVLALLIAGAVTGAYAQDILKQEDPAVNDVVQIGVIYAGSICSEEHKPAYSEFYFRVTRMLANGWVEAEYNSYMAYEYHRYKFTPFKRPLRLNLAQMCSIQPFVPAD